MNEPPLISDAMRQAVLPPNFVVSATLMRFAACTHCRHLERLSDTADSVPNMCNGCGHLHANKLVGVTDPEIARKLLVEFPNAPDPKVKK